MIYLVREYIKYCLIAKNRHGIHSPFVYDFNDRCLFLPIPDFEYQVFQQLKKSYLKNKDEIEVTDLGAGSRKLNKKRTVSQIAKVSGSNNKYGKLLYRLVAHYQPKEVLELGTSLGLGTYMMAAASEKIHITTVEGCKNTYEIARRSFPAAQHEKVDFVNNDFFTFLENLKDQPPFDMIFIDGDHKSESLFKQLKLLAPFIHDETIIVLDDIRWSKDMLGAWNDLVLSSEYQLTIDLFKMGIIMKRSHQQKESFIIRY
ncbi:class I SAM-dependent methyltransferase [Brumimicrobium glaciale]|uniref:Class I SAM-dependent methyltransferase n=1 Tax=Brumimicrobium glaciale TaxID=200475 RepID=A0A4Q4KHK4_9FLAO|nr:class I SAM-dependent methyltransferase [Brumimicrobium glaciale]RYM32328.1 class I SAM-dependent methyltransferase [Brumimicrobium glaciale]